MRKIALFALMASVAGACQSSLVETKQDMGPSQFYATIEAPGASDTKVFADENLKVLWNADDRITIFNNYTLPEQYRFTGTEGSNAGGFTAVPNPDEDEFNVGNELSSIYAVYPYDENITISNAGVVNVTLPAVQKYQEHSFGVAANTMMSVTADNFLRFKNVGGYLAFKLYGENREVSSISLQGNNHEKLAGPAKITMAEGGLPSVAMQSGATETLTLRCATPVSLGATSADCTDFWFVVPPVTFTKGFTLVVTTVDGATFTKTLSSSIKIDRNTLMRMAAFELVEEEAPAGPPIVIDGDFEDWDEIEGVSSGNHGMFKVTSDDNYLYFYSWRNTGGRYTEIWGAGYLYIAFNLDGDDTSGETLWGNGPYEFVGVIYPYGGTADSPAFNENPGDASLPETSTLANVECQGYVDASGAYIEFSIPRSDLPQIPNAEITVYCWGNKDMTKVTLNCTL